MKHYIIFLVIIAFLTGCTTTVSSDEKEKAPSDISAIQNSSIAVAEDNNQTDNTEVPAIGGDDSREVKSVGTSYKELEELSGKNRSELSEFDIDLCYFKMKNIPKEFEEKYASIWEIGFIANYVNEETCERLELTWWAKKEPDVYLKSIQNIRNVKVVNIDNIDYYCKFAMIGEEGKGMVPYHAEIRWIEDGKCLYVNFVSAKPIDESVLKYCELEKFTID